VLIDRLGEEMAVLCQKCKRQYDITLFQFGQAVKCDCGSVVELKEYYPLNKEKEDKFKRPPERNR